MWRLLAAVTMRRLLAADSIRSDNAARLVR
jgi:hypothetical protein